MQFSLYYTFYLFITFLERAGTYDGHKGTVWGCDVTYFSKYLITGSADGYCFIWDVKTGFILKEIKHRGPVRAVAFSEGDKFFATVTNPFRSTAASFSIFKMPEDGDFSSSEMTPIIDIVDTPLKKGQKFNCVKWLPLNAGLMLGSTDGSIYIYDPTTGELVSHSKLNYL